MVAPWYARLILGALAGTTLIVLFGPVFVVSFFSFFRQRKGEVQWDSFTFDWYGKLFENDSIMNARFNSVVVGFFAVLAALVLGTLFAIYYNGRGRGRDAQQFVIFLPFLLPPIITGLTLLIFFREVGIDRSLVTVAFGHTLFVLALAYRIILTQLQSLSHSLVEASYDLGANRWQTVWYVLLPNIRTALVIAAVLAFALSFDETLISLFLVGREMTLPVRLWGMMRVGFKPEVNALVTLIILFSGVLFLIVARLARRTSDDMTQL